MFLSRVFAFVYCLLACPYRPFYRPLHFPKLPEKRTL